MRLFCLLPGRLARSVLTLLILGLVLPVVAGAPGPLHAASASEMEGAKRKINLAGRQRMLAQRMAMLSCMAGSGVQHDSALTRAGAAHDLFAKSLKGLRFGDSEQGLPVETHPEVLLSLDVVDGLWTGYGAAVADYVRSDSPSTLRSIHARNMPVLVKMNDSVTLIETLYAEGTVDPEIATALNIAGRQRMLLMKALKEACMVGRGYAPDADREELHKTISLFSSSLYKLRLGNAWDGIIAPPTFEVDMQLELVQAIWDWMEPYLKEVAAGGEVDAERLSELLYHGEVALTEMNVAVWLYEQV